MKCPYCSYSESKVVDSRPTEENEKIRRRRECLRCLKRFTTYEVIETTPLMVIKKDRSREPFDRAKLIAGMMRACEKRPIGIAQIEQAVSEIETAMQNSLEREISSDRIGEMAMEKLKEIDEVAYVRFASVYREFQDIESFMEELHSLMASKQN